MMTTSGNFPHTGKLFVVSTPIGNLSDLSDRIRETIKLADFLIAEDTRVSSKILRFLKIKKPILKFHGHSGRGAAEKIVQRIKNGESGALVCDAGTPGISDPGPELIEKARKDNIKIVPIPGLSAVTCLYSVSGFRGDKFAFWGFIPKKKGRDKFLKALKESEIPIVFFESPYRFARLIDDLNRFLEPEREIVIGRELTKKFEDIKKLTIKDLKNNYPDRIKGEITVVVNKRTEI